MPKEHMDFNAVIITGPLSCLTYRQKLRRLTLLLCYVGNIIHGEVVRMS